MSSASSASRAPTEEQLRLSRVAAAKEARAATRRERAILLAEAKADREHVRARSCRLPLVCTADQTATSCAQTEHDGDADELLCVEGEAFRVLPPPNDAAQRAQRIGILLPGTAARPSPASVCARSPCAAFERGGAPHRATGDAFERGAAARAR
eukprot:1110807-Pleurochrysis_carterae.AAC.1